MFETAFTFGLTQFARSLSLPERLQRRPFRNAALELWRLRNTSLDALYYDIRALTSDEAFYISGALAAEGLIMIVPPTGQGMLTLCETVDEYLLRGGRQVRVMAVAGIGGSAAGSAAFARNVADAVGAPVAAVVSGYGLGDLVAEALGSNFFFGHLGFLRRNFEMIDDMVGRPHFGDYTRRPTLHDAPRRTSLDADTVEALLMHNELRFDLVTGHSKGNLIVNEALTAIAEEAPSRLAQLRERMRVISFGTRIALPEPLAAPLSVMGELDWYGEMNARGPTANTIRVPRAGHSTNTSLPGALNVTALLTQVLADQPVSDQPVSDQPMAKAQTGEAVKKPEPETVAKPVELKTPAPKPLSIVKTKPTAPTPEPVIEAKAEKAASAPVETKAANKPAPVTLAEPKTETVTVSAPEPVVIEAAKEAPPEPVAKQVVKPVLEAPAPRAATSDKKDVQAPQAGVTPAPVQAEAKADKPADPAPVVPAAVDAVAVTETALPAPAAQVAESPAVPPVIAKLATTPKQPVQNRPGPNQPRNGSRKRPRKR
ncbi:hypothetical protein [Allorhizobium taibaishanense]|uniref:Cell envelope biogenesis protein OmpA n=1 Tax=Allorhizobium taibaishanense TaxID=887144 RepID=A0A1Q9A3W9_9HYPH|nr:hypothetical protein [Allorhizobium taibaishanense]MBB4006341.1 hypothetical protein [Allorhizobium taibaishanense]OLP49295.1 hypothetical protein BJF91_19770 [Allorhizobium taibaishanense]